MVDATRHALDVKQTTNRIRIRISFGNKYPTKFGIYLVIVPNGVLIVTVVIADGSPLTRRIVTDSLWYCKKVTSSLSVLGSVLHQSLGYGCVVE